MASSFVQLYRSSVLCDLLQDTLEELMEEGKIGQDLGHKVLDGFDKSCLEALTKRAEAKAALSVRCCCLASRLTVTASCLTC